METIDAAILSAIDFRINVCPAFIKISKSCNGILWDEKIENLKSPTRRNIEHLFLIMKRQFRYCRTEHGGVAKNKNRFNILFASSNLLMCIKTRRMETFCMG